MSGKGKRRRVPTIGRLSATVHGEQRVQRQRPISNPLSPAPGWRSISVSNVSERRPVPCRHSMQGQHLLLRRQQALLLQLKLLWRNWKSVERQHLHANSDDDHDDDDDDDDYTSTPTPRTHDIRGKWLKL